ncbi:MAG: OmpA family protein [Oligoflexia bacterium]|nr:OmpA family protein [Oligoflexia bacterium]
MNFARHSCWILLAFTACSTGKVATEPLGGTDPTSEIQQLEERLSASKQQEKISLLAPEATRRTGQSLERARDLHARGANNDRILEETARASRELEQARKAAATSGTLLSEVIAARTEAVNANASRAFRTDFNETDARLLEATRAAEEGNLRVAQESRPDLLKDYRELSVKGLRETHFGESRRLIERAKAEGAEKWAPKTLASAEAKLQEGDQLIARSPEDTHALQRASSEARSGAELLLKVTRASRSAQKGRTEDMVVALEKQRMESAQLGQEAEQQKQRISELQKEQQANARYRQVRELFSEEEAEVLRRDGELIIRLKGLQFPSARATIPSKNFPLLRKLEQALALFPDAREVTIEGHTDSKGSKAKNEALSEKRANSVKEFLASSETIPQTELKVEGKGFSEPIASNRTREGRKQNRRVDVVLLTETG